MATRLAPYPHDLRVGAKPVRAVFLDGERIWWPLRSVGAATSGEGTLSAISEFRTTSVAVPATSGSGTLSATVVGVEMSARGADLSGSGVLAATGTSIQPSAAALSGSGTLGASVVKPFTHVFVPSVMPPELPLGNEFKFSPTGGTMTPASLTVNATPRLTMATPTGTANNGNYATGRCFRDPLTTALHFCEATCSGDTSGASYPRAAGVGVGGSDNVFTNGVVAFAANFNGANSLQVFTKTGSTLTQRATVNNQLIAGDKLRLVTTFNGANYVYTVYKNGVATACVWTDTGNVVTPGLWPAVILQGIYSSGWFGPNNVLAVGYGPGGA
jgi:hypothetical protein